MVHRGVYAPKSELDRGVPCRGIHDGVRHQNRVDQPRTFFEKGTGELNRDVGAPVGDPQDDPHSVPVGGVYGDACILYRHAR